MAVKFSQFTSIVPTAGTYLVGYDGADNIKVPYSSLVNGSGAIGQVAYWTGTSSQSGSNNLFWDAANNRLGIGTNTSLDFPLVLQGSMQVRNTASSFTGLRIDHTSIRLRNTGTFSLGSNDVATAINIFSNNNVGIGQTTDGGQRLQVNGDAFIKGSGNTSGTTALTVHNSDASNVFRVRNDGVLVFGNAVSNQPLLYTGGVGSPSLSSRLLVFGLNNHNDYANNESGFTVLTNVTSTSAGTSNAVRFASSFGPSSGSHNHTFIFSNPTINQTGGANGITRGLYVNPTLTAAADWRSIEWSNSTGWGLYGDGSARNYLRGKLGIGTTDLTSNVLRVKVNIEGGSNIYNIIADGQIRSDVTNTSRYYSTIANTQAASFTLTNLWHYEAEQGTFGASSAVTTQIGFRAASSLTGATNNYGFYGDIASGTGRWNLYMNGTAANYMNGNLLLGSTVDGGQKLQVTGNAIVTGDLTVTKSGTTTFTFAGAGAFQYDVVGTGSQLLYNSTSGNFRTKFAGNNFGMIVGATSATQTSGVTLLIATRADRANNIFESSVSPQFSSINQTLSTISLSATVSFDPTNNLTGSIQSGVRIGETFAPNTANKDIQYIGLNIASTINQSIATQITRGLYINPTLTAAADWRSLEWSNNTGFGLYGAGTATNYLAGNLGIGTTSPGSKLQVDGSGVISSNLTTGPFTINTPTGDFQSGILWRENGVIAAGIFRENNASTWSTPGALWIRNLNTTGTLKPIDIYAESVRGFNNTPMINFGYFGTVGSGPAPSSVVQTGLAFGKTSTYNWIQGFGGQAVSINPLGNNVLIGTTTDAGYKLDVVGGFRCNGNTVINFTQNTTNVHTFQLYSRTSDLFHTTLFEATGNTGQFKFRSTSGSRSSDGDFVTIDGRNNTGGTTITAGNTLAIFSNVNKEISGSKSINISQSRETGGSIANPIAYGLDVSASIYGTGNGTNYGIRSTVTNTSTGVGTTIYAVYADASGATNNFGIYSNSGINYFGSSVGIGTTTPNASAILQADSTTKGMLPPRMTNAQMVAIATPAAGLVVYDTTNNKLNVYDGTAWVAVH